MCTFFFVGQTPIASVEALGQKQERTDPISRFLKLLVAREFISMSFMLIRKHMLDIESLGSRRDQIGTRVTAQAHLLVEPRC